MLVYCSKVRLSLDQNKGGKKGLIKYLGCGTLTWKTERKARTGNQFALLWTSKKMKKNVTDGKKEDDTAVKAISEFTRSMLK